MTFFWSFIPTNQITNKKNYDFVIVKYVRYLIDEYILTEAESDQEPSSTVDNAAATIWNGCINMVDVARFYVAAHEVQYSNIFLLIAC